MAKNDKKNRKKQSNKAGISPVPFQYGNEETKREQISSVQNTNSSSHPPQNDKRKTFIAAMKDWKLSDKISFWHLVTNVVLVLGTGIAIYFTYKSVKLTRKAVADNVENFRLQNMPYLQVGDFKYRNDTFFFRLFNLNQYPAKVKRGGFAASGQPTIGNLGAITTPNDSFPTLHIDGTFTMRPTSIYTVLNKYVIKDSPIDAFIPKVDHIFFSNKHGYFLGQFFYTDEVGLNERMYECVIRIYGTPSNIKADFIENFNVTLSED